MLNDFDFKLNTNKKIALNIIIFLVAVFLLLFFLILPTINDIKAIESEITIQMVELEKKYQRGQSLKKLAEHLKMIETQLDKLDQVFIDKEDQLLFITTLENIADASQVTQKINLIAEPEMEKGENYQKLPLQIFTQGDFVSQLKYLINLESLNYYINIKSLELNSAPSAGNGQNIGQGNINMFIIADTYWR